MAAENRFRQESRLSRIVRLLRQFRPDLPESHRHNRVLLFPSGHSFFRSLHSSLALAEHFILVEFYIIHADHTGAAFASDLADAVNRGVRVRLIYDYVGCINTPASFFEDMAGRGIEAIPFNVPSLKKGLRWLDRRNHHKMVIIDGSLAYLGGLNIGDEYSGMVEKSRRFRDLGLSISGSAVTELTRHFSEIWQMEKGELPLPSLIVGDADPNPRRSGHAEVSIVSGVPHQRRSYIRSAFLFSIASAAEEILIATPYFIPGPRVIRSILRAARRGVKVRLLLPERSDLPLVRLLGRSYYDTLLRQGIEISELRREILHAKVMLIDGERTVIGSANLDQRSFHRNYELNCIVEDAAFGRQVKRVLLKDFTNSRRVTEEDHKRRGLIARFLEKLINLLGRFL